MRDWQELARTVGQKMSTDPNTRVGCDLLDGATLDILSIGWNSFPNRVDKLVQARWDRPTKYFFVCHAELNAICRAACNGVRLEGATFVLNIHPCSDCSRALIQAGVKKIITSQPDLDHPRWGPDWRFAVDLFQEAGVAISYEAVGRKSGAKS
jgi:dCMP deaminase